MTSCIWKANVLQRWHTRSNSVLRIHDLSVYWKEVPLTSVRVLFMSCKQSLEPLWQLVWLKGQILHVIGPAVYQSTDIHEVCYNKLVKQCSLFDFCNVEIQNQGIILALYALALLFASQIPADKAVCLKIGYKVLPQSL